MHDNMNVTNVLDMSVSGYTWYLLLHF